MDPGSGAGMTLCCDYYWIPARVGDDAMLRLLLDPGSKAGMTAG